MSEKLSTRWLAVLVALHGCGGDSAGRQAPTDNDGPASSNNAATGTPEPLPIDIDSIKTALDFDAAFARAICNVEQRCSEPSDDYPNYGDQCATQLAKRTASWAPTPASVHYDSAKGASCLAFVDAIPCDEVDYVALLSACSNVKSGDSGEGDECSPSTICRPNLYCATSASTCSGTCKPLPQAGEDCSASVRCADSAGCVITSEVGSATLTLECRALVAEGEPCGTRIGQCQEGLGCDDDTEGKCHPLAELAVPVGLNQACRGDRQCAEGLQCAQALAPPVCTQRIEAGQTCTPGEAHVCVPDYYCATTDAGSVCAPKIAFGDACKGVDSEECAEGECVKSACGFRSGFGESCTDDNDCYSFECIDGACTYPGGCR
ncbi:MAG TPA: hypothetical protein VHM70_04440 [Polyangiaceae bacterium]|jgi:hypothetical protein|nr:hypothetical protein [Polyangiaceae bacterium]